MLDRIVLGTIHFYRMYFKVNTIRQNGFNINYYRPKTSKVYKTFSLSTRTHYIATEPNTCLSDRRANIHQFVRISLLRFPIDTKFVGGRTRFAPNE